MSKALPKARSWSNDRAPTIEEIRKLVGFTDRRIKPIVYTMCSSGIRVGAWDYLQWKHVSPIANEEGEIIAAKLLVYAGEPEEYYTFITPEAYNALDDYMDFRASCGEKITGESWLMRNRWKTVDVLKGGLEKHSSSGGDGGGGGRFGLATHPRKLPANAIKKILVRALSTQGIRKVLPEGARRHEWKSAHGYRKFFETRAAQVMSSINVEFLMGHSLGLTQSYYKPTEPDLLAAYLKAVDLLTINDNDKTTLKKQVAELTEKSKEENYIIEGKLAEKEKEIEAAAREAEHTKRELAEMKARQGTFEERTNKQVEKLTQVIAELIARDQDLSRDNPQDAKKLDRTVDDAINHCADYFGDDSFLNRKGPPSVVCLEEEEKK